MFDMLRALLRFLREDTQPNLRQRLGIGETSFAVTSWERERCAAACSPPLLPRFPRSPLARCEGNEPNHELCDVARARLSGEFVIVGLLNARIDTPRIRTCSPTCW